MKEVKSSSIIDLEKVVKVIWQKRKIFWIVLPIVFVLSCVWIFPEPRYYDCDVALAPESSSEAMGGGLSSIASSFGFDLGGLNGSDAIYPLLYPDLFESPEFLVGLSGINIRTLDGEINTDYYTYLKDHQKKNVLTKPFDAISNYFKSLFEKEETRGGDSSGVDPFLMSQNDFNLMNVAKQKITCSVDKMTNVISINVRDQDPLVCALMADSVKEHLQNFITQYRTSKARQDCDYYQHLTDSARTEYEAALQLYTAYCDTHKDVILQAYISERDKLENDMSEKYSTYSAMNTQLQAMRAKVQERTPSFTTLKSATVPVKPSGPKRMFFVIGMVILSFLITSIWCARNVLLGKE